jgi:hypothetical protein
VLGAKASGAVRWAPRLLLPDRGCTGISRITGLIRLERFLLHDNDGIFGQYRDGRKRREKRLRYRSHLDLWLREVMGFRGIPIPYGVPSANARVERFHRSLREEALNHFIFLSERHS